jgi:hypothetical protein
VYIVQVWVGSERDDVCRASVLARAFEADIRDVIAVASGRASVKCEAAAKQCLAERPLFGLFLLL